MSSWFVKFLACGLAVLMSCSFTPAWSQGRVVNVIVPYVPGGNLDLNARALAGQSKDLGTDPWVVINRPGASGNVGLAEVMRAKPDGRTIVLTGGAYLLQGLTADVPWKGHADFDQIAIVMATHNLHFVRSDSQFKTLNQLIDYSKKKPGEINYGAVGPNGVGTIRYLLLRHATGINWTEIPYPGDSAVLNAILGGHIHTGAAAATAVMPHVKAGRLIIIAVPSSERVPSIPDVPTFKELGYPVVLPTLNVVMAPKGVPGAVLQELRHVVERGTATPEYKKFVDNSGGEYFVRIGDQTKPVLDELLASYRSAVPLMNEYIKENTKK